MIEKYIWEFGSLIFMILGSIHLVYIFFTNKIDIRSAGAIYVSVTIIKKRTRAKVVTPQK